MAFDATARANGSLVVLDMRGEIDGAADERLNAAYAEATASDAKRVLLRFDDVTYINSTGIALLVGLLAEARGSDRAVLACGLTDHYKEIFEITRIADFMTVFDDEAAAAAAPV
ncbi:MAG: STAS domain-containing protein [Actinomycetota bacterium]